MRLAFKTVSHKFFRPGTEKMGRGFYGRISDTDRKAFPITELSLRKQISDNNFLIKMYLTQHAVFKILNKK